MKALLLILTTILVNLASYAQSPQVIFKEINQLKASGATPTDMQIVKFLSTEIHQRDVDLQGLSKGTIVSLSQDAIEALLLNRNDLIQIQLPVDERHEMTLTLKRQEIFTSDFTLYASSDPGTPVNYTPGVHYKGIVDGEPTSVVALSVFNDQIMGMIATDQGNFVIGRIDHDPENRHIFYNDKDLDAPFQFECSTPDDGLEYTKEQLSSQPGPRDVGDCVRVYFEIDDDVVTDKGGLTGAVNFLTSAFNQVSTLYANENITMSISEILAWTTNSPYSGNSGAQMLTSFQNNTGSFTGDLAHLVSYQAMGNGIAASASGICNSNPDLSKCFSGIFSSYIVIPTFSWTVDVITHEMGHLMGSRHTHACVWNFNNTAIDGCAGATEGNCPLPGNPAGGGTIMSYCHTVQGIGVNFNLGFGTQPGNVIRNTVNTIDNCLSVSCTPPPPEYCWLGGSPGQPGHDMWIQSVALGSINNNSGNSSGYADFTGQSTTLSVGNAYTITLTAGNEGINFAKKWAVWIDYNHDFDFEDSGEEVATGSGSSGVNLNFTVPASSPSVTTRMRVAMKRSDQPGTLLPCGNAPAGEVEDYTLVVDATGGPTCADGAQNGDETGVDCGGTTCPVCPTCTDGIQNGDEDGIDCGGSCNDCPGTNLFGHFFETGWNGWTDGGVDAERYSGSRSWEGNYSINLQDNSAAASAMTSPAVNLTGFTAVQLSFYFYANSMENGEDFFVQYYNGSAYTTVATLQAGYGGHFTNNSFWAATVILTSTQVNFVSNARFRIQCDAGDNNDDIYIDQVTLEAFTATALVYPGLYVRSVVRDDHVTIDSKIEASEIVLYPNPVVNEITLRNTNQEMLGEITIYNTIGRRILQKFVSASETSIDVSDLPEGMYLITTGQFSMLKFVKQ